jgi:hypothetical protein
MSKLIIQWLNEEVKLSQRVVSLEEDFRDGYLLGELLYKYNQQMDFDRFSPNGGPEAKIHNFCMIELTMRQIKVPFSSKVATEIMDGRDGAIKTFLYALKTALDVIDRNSRQSINPNLRGTRNDKILLAINASKPAFNKTMSTTFENTVRAEMENPNEYLLAKATKRYKEIGEDFRSSASNNHSTMFDTMARDMEKDKDASRYRKEREEEFDEAWESINLEQWKINQTISRDRKNVKRKVDMDRTNRLARNKTLAYNKAREETLSNIDTFDQRLDATVLTAKSDAGKKASGTAELQLIKTIKDVPGRNAPDLVYIDSDVLQLGFDLSQKRRQEVTEDYVSRKKMHDRRRRKFLREFDNTQAQLSQSYFEDDLVSQILNECRSEVLEHQKSKKLLSYIDIITENRTNRNEKIDSMNDEQRERKDNYHKEEAIKELVR